VIFLGAGRHREEHTAVRREHTAQLRERLRDAGVVALGVCAVDAVVAPDVLERRDAADDVERLVGERQRAQIADDRLDSLHRRFDGIEPHHLAGRSGDERVEVRR